MNTRQSDEPWISWDMAIWRLSVETEDLGRFRRRRRQRYLRSMAMCDAFDFRLHGFEMDVLLQSQDVRCPDLCDGCHEVCVIPYAGCSPILFDGRMFYI